MDDKNTESVKTENPEVEKKENEVRPADQVKERKRNRDEKGRKKDDKKAAEQFLRSLNDVQTVEEKLEAMCKKYSEIIDENKKLQLMLKQSEKKVMLLQREKEQYQSERSKAVLTRRRLESLCRELQKQNKAVKEESLLKLREEEEKRKEVSAKFQSTLAEITALMNQNIEKNTKMHEDNLEINKKIKSVYEQVELKELQLLMVHQQMKDDLQLAHTKLAKVKMEATAEKEALLKEKQQLLFKLTEYQVQIRELQATEIGLRSQISMYTDKYDEFQNALTRSNKVYGEFNEEIEKLSKRILTLEKETSLWKQRWENSHAALLEMAADKQIRDSEMATLSKKLSLLQDLCKMFQRERTSLLAQLKEKNGTTQSPQVPTTGEISQVGESSQMAVTTQSVEIALAEAVASGEISKKEEEQIKTIKQVDELSQDCLKLQNTFGQLQESLSKVSEAIEKELAQENSNTETLDQQVNSDAAKQIENETVDVPETELINSNEQPCLENGKSETEVSETKITELTEESNESEVKVTSEQLNEENGTCQKDSIIECTNCPVTENSDTVISNIEKNENDQSDETQVCNGNIEIVSEEIHSDVENRCNGAVLDIKNKAVQDEIKEKISEIVQSVAESSDANLNEETQVNTNICTNDKSENEPENVQQNETENDVQISQSSSNSENNLCEKPCNNGIVPTEAINNEADEKLSEKDDSSLVKESSKEQTNITAAGHHSEAKLNNSTPGKNGKRKKK